MLGVTFQTKNISNDEMLAIGYCLDNFLTPAFGVKISLSLGWKQCLKTPDF